MDGTERNLTRYVIAGMIASGVYVAAALADKPAEACAPGDAAREPISAAVAPAKDVVQ